eukprot:3389889-Pyramimonas_sp.AAC.1
MQPSRTANRGDVVHRRQGVPIRCGSRRGDSRVIARGSPARCASINSCNRQTERATHCERISSEAQSKRRTRHAQECCFVFLVAWQVPT